MKRRTIAVFVVQLAVSAVIGLIAASVHAHPELALLTQPATLSGQAAVSAQS